jgi:hypothetical protein
MLACVSVRAQEAPHEGSYTHQLESRVRTLETEIKAMRETLDEEIKSLREALARTTEARPQAADTVVAGGAPEAATPHPHCGIERVWRQPSSRR